MINEDPSPASEYPDGQTRQQWLAAIKAPKVPNPLYERPSSTAKIWRYMDFTKFVSMLESEALFFSRAALLEDQFEGSVSAVNLALRASERERRIEFFSRGESGSVASIRAQAERSDESQADWRQWERDLTYINCWHLSEIESAAMWKVYCKTNESVAIQTTFGDLDAGLELHRTRQWGSPFFVKSTMSTIRQRWSKLIVISGNLCTSVHRLRMSAKFEQLFNDCHSIINGNMMQWLSQLQEYH